MCLQMTHVLACAAGNAEIPSLGVEFPSEEMELATQDVREMTEKEDDINLDFSKLSKKLQTVRAPSFALQTEEPRSP